MRGVDLHGQRFGRLTVIALAERKCGTALCWRCTCDCGNITEVASNDLRRPKRGTRSCGCLAREQARTNGAANLRHGMHESPTYESWEGMIARCYRPKNIAFAHYGGRGIRVCDRWRDFRNFHADMGERPAGMSLDRINNADDYRPENCRWATPLEQARNTRRNRVLTFQGRSQCVSAWAQEIGVHRNTLLWRIRNDWSVDRVLAGEPR